MSHTLPTNGLRAALASVVAHAGTDPDVATFFRVRLVVAGREATLTATNGWTAAAAIVPVYDTDGELLTLDLSPGDVANVLHLFRAGKGGAEAGEDTLTLEADAKHLTLTDTSGLFEGERLRLLRYPTDEKMPDVTQVVADWVDRARTASDDLLAAGALVKLFTVAARQFAAPLVIQPTGGRSPLLISCGRQFIGLLMPMHADETDDAMRARWRVQWRDRLPAPRPSLQAAAAALAFTTLSVQLDDVAHGDLDDDEDDEEPVDLDEHDDPLLHVAALAVLEQGGSQTMLRRHLGIGSGRAEALMHRLQALGVVGPATHRRSREVLLPHATPLDVLASCDVVAARLEPGGPVQP